MKNSKSPRKAPVKKLDSWQALTDAVRRFLDERDWSQFYTPKNLAAAIAIAIEAGELQKQFPRKTDEENSAESEGGSKREAVVEEISEDWDTERAYVTIKAR